MICQNWPQVRLFCAPADRDFQPTLASCEDNLERTMTRICGAITSGSKETWWSQHREASLNWLALGLLLAAWNAADNGATTQAKRRPESLRGYAYVSVRAQRSASTSR
jgi:hypothetical protein